MINGVIIKKLNKNIDKRGWLCEVFRSDEINYKPAMAYVSVTEPGVVRGPHEHKKQSDCFVFVGPGDVLFYLWDNRKKSKTKGEYLKMRFGASSPSLIIVPPGVVHGYKCIGRTPALYINFPDKLYRGRNKKSEADEIRWERDPKSPFKIA